MDINAKNLYFDLIFSIYKHFPNFVGLKNFIDFEIHGELNLEEAFCSKLNCI